MLNKRDYFDKIYKEKVFPIIDIIEQKRRRLLKIIRVATCIIWFLLVPVSFWGLKRVQAEYNAIFVGIFAQILLSTIVKSFYQNEVRDNILRSIIFSVEGLEYEPQYNTDPNFLENSEIAPEFDHMFVSDYITGKHNGRKFSFYKINLKSISNKNIVDTFKGYVLTVDLNKTLKSTVTVKAKTLFRIDFDIFSDKQEVILEDPTFNKYFKVMSVDQIEARKILTAKLMEKMNKLANLLQMQNAYANKYKGNLLEYIRFKISKLNEPVIKPGRFNCIFSHNYMMMLIPTDYEFFNCSNLNIPADKKLFDDFVNDLLTIYEIIEIL